MSMRSGEKKSIKKRIFILAVAALLLLSAVFVCFKLFSGGESAQGSDLPVMQSYSIRLDPPEDGSLPEDHSALENIGYIIGKLSMQEYYHTESTSVANASALGGMVNVKQNVLSSKDYKEGVLIVTAISTGESSFAPSKAMQRFYGEDLAVVRYAASDNKSDWNGFDTEWSTGEPAEVLKKEQHINRYGLWATEFSDYVITEETLLTPDATVEKDGEEYVLTVSLSVREDAETGKKDAAEYYKRQMRTMGDLDDYPSFSSAQLIFRFREDWTITSLETVEEYSSKKGFEANCKGSNVTTYSYELSDVDISAYDSYFKKYANAAVTTPEEETLTALDYLSAGFAPLLSEEESLLALEADVSGTKICGDAALSMEGGQFGGLRMCVGDLYLSYEEGNIFLRYRDFFGKLALSDCSSFLPDLGELDLASLESAIGNGTLEETDTGATIVCSLPLGDLVFPLRFSFVRNEEEIRWSSIDAELSDLGVSLHVVPGTVCPPREDVTQAVDLAPMVQDILALIEGKKFEIGLSYADEQLGLSVTGELTLDIADGLNLIGALEVTYKNITLPLQVSYVSDEVRVNVYEVRLKGSADEIAELVSAVAELAGAELPAIPSFSVETLMESLLQLDYEDLVRGLSLTEEGLSAQLNVGGLLSAVTGTETGELLVEAEYSVSEGKLKAEAAGMQVELCAGDADVTALEGEFVSLSAVTKYLAPVQKILEKGGLTAAGTLCVEAEGVSVEIGYALDVLFADGLKVYGQLNAGTIQVKIAYTDGKLYAELFGAKGYVSVSKLAKLLGAEGSAEAEALSQVLETIDVTALLESIRIWEDGDALRIAAAIEGIEAEVCLSTDGDKIGIESEGVSFAGIQVKDLNAEVYATEEANVWDVSGAPSLEPVIDSILALIEGKKFEIGLSYADEQLGLSVTGVLTLDIADGISVVGDLEISYKTLVVPVRVTLIGENVWLKAENILVTATLGELEQKLPELLEVVGLNEPASADAASLIESLLGMDYTALVRKFVLQESGFELILDGDVLLEGLKLLPDGFEFEVGTISLSYDVVRSAFVGNLLGAELTISQGTKTVSVPENAADYVPVERLLQFVGPVKSWLDGKDVSLTLSGQTVIQNLVIRFEISGEVWFADGVQIYLRVLVNDEHLLEIFERDGNVQIAYNGFRLDISQNDLKTVADTMSSLFAGSTDASSDEAAMLLFSADGIDLQALLSSIRLLAVGEDALGVALDLSALLEGALAEGLVLSTTDATVTAQAEKVGAFGIVISSLQASCSAAENVFAPDLDKNIRCQNVFEFLMNAYLQATGSDDLALSLVYDTADLYAAVDGYIELERSTAVDAGPAELILNLSFRAQIFEGGKDSPSGSHFISLTILREMLYISYSTVAAEGGNPLQVSMPVAQLIACGKTALPILAPILGIREDVYYYNFVVSILDGYVETINSAVFGVMNTKEWCDLILGIVDEYSSEDTVAESESFTSSDIRLDTQNRSVSLSLGEISLSLSATQMEKIEAPADQAEYIDISSIASLLQDLEYSYRYADTGGYTLTGTLTLSLSLGALNLVKVPVSLEMRVGFEEGETLAERDPYFYIKTFVPKKSLGISIIAADTMSEIVIRNGNVYILRSVGESAISSQQTYREFMRAEQETHFLFWKHDVYYYDVTTRYQYHTVSADYRAMTLSDFFGGGTQSLINQFAFIFNLSETVVGMIPSGDEGSQTGSSSAYDAGDMVNSYQYVASGGTEKEGYALSLNLAAIANNSDLGNLDVKIERSLSKVEDDVSYYDLTALDLGMDLLGGVINVNGRLRHEAPGSDSFADSFSKETIGVFTSNGVTVSAGTVAEGKVSLDRTWIVDRTEEEDLCTKCDESEAARWGKNSWKYDAAAGTWILVG